VTAAAPAIRGVSRWPAPATRNPLAIRKKGKPQLPGEHGHIADDRAEQLMGLYRAAVEQGGRGQGTPDDRGAPGMADLLRQLKRLVEDLGCLAHLARVDLGNAKVGQCRGEPCLVADPAGDRDALLEQRHRGDQITHAPVGDAQAVLKSIVTVPVGSSRIAPDITSCWSSPTAASAQQLVDALRPAGPLLVHCGTIWVHGPALRVPVTEDEPRTAYGEYGTGKAEIEALLHRETRAGGVPAIVLHPGHISGPGWPVITPAGNLDPQVWTKLATGQPLALPDHGLGILNHVHADDVAQAFERALAAPAAAGTSFHVVAEQAMTLRGLAAGAAGWFGREPVLEFVDWAEFSRRAGPGHAEATREHTFRGIAASIDRARQTLGYAPRFSSLDALHEALAWLVADGRVDVGGQPFQLTPGGLP
jgi:nucleoside-diphosphate-sugar epimerase